MDDFSIADEDKEFVQTVVLFCREMARVTHPEKADELASAWVNGVIGPFRGNLRSAIPFTSNQRREIIVACVQVCATNLDIPHSIGIAEQLSHFIHRAFVLALTPLEIRLRQFDGKMNALNHIAVNGAKTKKERQLLADVVGFVAEVSNAGELRKNLERITQDAATSIADLRKMMEQAKEMGIEGQR